MKVIKTEWNKYLKIIMIVFTMEKKCHIFYYYNLIFLYKITKEKYVKKIVVFLNINYIFNNILFQLYVIISIKKNVYSIHLCANADYIQYTQHICCICINKKKNILILIFNCY